MFVVKKLASYFYALLSFLQDSGNSQVPDSTKGTAAHSKLF